MPIGWLGGTFDPIHNGHLDVARAARDAMGLETVLVGPSGRPPHRAAPVASASDRLAMAALAVEGQPGLQLSDMDMRPDAPSYTWDLLDRLADSGIDLRALMVITGADAFRDIRSWRRFPALLDRCHFVVVSRPGHPAPRLRVDLSDLASRMHDAPCPAGPEPGIFLVDMPTAPVASTDIRRALAEARAIDGMVPPAVQDYIRHHHLYVTKDIA